MADRRFSISSSFLSVNRCALSATYSSFSQFVGTTSSDAISHIWRARLVTLVGSRKCFDDVDAHIIPPRKVQDIALTLYCYRSRAICVRSGFYVLQCCVQTIVCNREIFPSHKIAPFSSI